MAEAPKKKIISDSQVMRRNLVVAFVLMFILLLLYVTIPGYNYAIKEVAIGNKQRIDQIETRKINFNLPEITWELKRQFRIEDYWYIQTIQDVTPKNFNTVVLLPPHSAVDSTPQFKELSDPEWMEYFLYPRLCVSEDEKETKKELYAKVNYVAIVNNWGYDKLKYEPAGRPSEAVMPVVKPIEDSTRYQSPVKKNFYGDSNTFKPNAINQ
jgi:hypothetical protein